MTATAEPQTEGAPPLKPETINRVLQGEIARLEGEVKRLNDNRLYLIGAMEEVRDEAMTEIGRLRSQHPAILSLIEDEDNRKEVQEFLYGPQPQEGDSDDVV